VQRCRGAEVQMRYRGAAEQRSSIAEEQHCRAGAEVAQVQVAQVQGAQVQGAEVQRGRVKGEGCRGADVQMCIR